MSKFVEVTRVFFNGTIWKRCDSPELLNINYIIAASPAKISDTWDGTFIMQAEDRMTVDLNYEDFKKLVLA